MHVRTILLTAAALLAAGCTTTGADTHTAQNAGRDCFLNSEINGWNVIDPHTIRVSVSPGREYALTVPTNTSDLNFNETIVVRSRSSDWICTGTGNDVRIHSRSSFPRTWWVTNVTRLPPRTPAAPAAPATPPQGS